MWPNLRCRDGGAQPRRDCVPGSDTRSSFLVPPGSCESRQRACRPPLSAPVVQHCLCRDQVGSSTCQGRRAFHCRERCPHSDASCRVALPLPCFPGPRLLSLWARGLLLRVFCSNLELQYSSCFCFLTVGIWGRAI